MVVEVAPRPLIGAPPQPTHMALQQLFKALSDQPEVLAEHAAAYAALASAELGAAARHWRRRLVLQLIAAGLAMLGLGLGGVAILLIAAIPIASMPAAWALAALPLAMLILAALLGWWQHRLADRGSLDALRAQWALDCALWREVSDS